MYRSSLTSLRKNALSLLIFFDQAVQGRDDGCQVQGDDGKEDEEDDRFDEEKVFWDQLLKNSAHSLLSILQ